MVQIDLVDDAELEALTNKIKVDWWNNFMEQEWKQMICSFMLILFILFTDHKWDGSDEKGKIWRC